MNDVAARLEECFLTVFPDLPRERVAAAAMTSVEEWDSVTSVTLLSVVEEEFGVSLGSDVDALVSFEAILRHLRAGSDGQEEGHVPGRPAS